MKNNKGFTLIELLATISLLAVLMLIAVPNVIGVVNRNKNNTYIEDAKKLVSLAEYKIRSNSDWKPTTVGTSKCIYMDDLDREDFDSTAPNGGTYMFDKSYVKATRVEDGKITYKVVLVENKYPSEKDGAKQDTEFIGIITETDSARLYDDEISGLISSTDNVDSISCS